MNAKFPQDKLIIVIWLVFAIMFGAIYSHSTFTPVFTTPDESVNYLFSNRYRDTGHLYYDYEEDLNAIAQNTIHPRYTIIYQEKIVSYRFIGLPIYYGALSGISKDVLPYLTPIIAVIGALFLYLLGKELFGRRSGIICLLLLFILPPYWYWSNFPFHEIVFGSVFFVLGLVYFFKGLSSHSPKHYILAALFLGTSWNIRLDTVLFLLPLLLILIVHLILMRNKVSIKSYVKLLFPSLIIFGIVVSPILLLNYQLYGGPLTTGYSIAFWGGSSISSPGERPLNPFINLELVVKAAPLFIFIIIGWLMCFRRQNFKSPHNIAIRRKYIVFILLSICIFFFYYLTRWSPWMWLPSNLVAQPPIRYFFPIYLACVPLFSLLIQRLWRWKRSLGILFILAVIILSVNTVFTALAGDNGIWSTREAQANQRNYIIENTEPDSIIFVGIDAKFIYPARKTGNIESLLKLGGNPEERLAGIMLNLSKEHIPLYYMWGYPPIDLNTFENELEERGLELKRLDESNLYKIVQAQR